MPYDVHILAAYRKKGYWHVFGYQGPFESLPMSILPLLMSQIPSFQCSSEHLVFVANNPSPYDKPHLGLGLLHGTRANPRRGPVAAVGGLVAGRMGKLV